MNKIEAEDYLRESVKSLIRDDLREICWRVLDNPKFYIEPAAKKYHHNYDGGLAVHTAEVMNVALAMAKSKVIKPNIGIIITSIIWHDYGKVFNYKLDQETDEQQYESTKHHKLIDHLPRSYAEFLMSAKSYNIPEEDILGISHCILAHHGRYEWRSPILPQTIEAFIIHSADMVSSQYIK